MFPYTKDGLVNENLLGITEINQLNSKYLSDIILKYIFELNTSNKLSQCYYGASMIW